MNMPFAINLATKNDLVIVYDFVCKLEEQTFNYEQFKGCFLENLENPRCRYWLIFDEQTPVGYVSLHWQILLHHVGRVGEVQELFVIDEYRNRGIGKILLDFVEDFAKQHDIMQIEVASNNRRTDAHRFYERNNYLKTHFKFVKKSPYLS